MNRISLSVMLLVGIAALSCREQDKAAIPVSPLEGSVIPHTRENKSIPKAIKFRKILCFSAFSISNYFANIS